MTNRKEQNKKQKQKNGVRLLSQPNKTFSLDTGPSDLGCCKLGLGFTNEKEMDLSCVIRTLDYTKGKILFITNFG